MTICIKNIFEALKEFLLMPIFEPWHDAKAQGGYSV
jgi:hypothetical protein